MEIKPQQINKVCDSFRFTAQCKALLKQHTKAVINHSPSN